MINSPHKVQEVIMKYLGTPYSFKGNSLIEGFDCVNLCTAIGKEFGIVIPNINHSLCTVDNYSTLFNKVKDNQSLWLSCNPKVHSLAVFKINGIVKHVGYMLNDYEFVHIMENSKVTVDNLDSIQWSRRLVSCYEYVGHQLEIE